MTSDSAALARLQKSFGNREIAFGCGGLKVFSGEHLTAQQVGYSVSPDGANLCTDGQGSWQSGWLVIGYDTCMGNPLFVDSANAELPVFTAYHGEGAWHPSMIAASADNFVSCLTEFERIASGRENPVQLNKNPVTEVEREAFLKRVKALSPSAPLDMYYWDALLDG